MIMWATLSRVLLLPRHHFATQQQKATGRNEASAEAELSTNWVSHCPAAYLTLTPLGLLLPLQHSLFSEATFSPFQSLGGSGTAERAALGKSSCHSLDKSTPGAYYSVEVSYRQWRIQLHSPTFFFLSRFLFSSCFIHN